MSKGNELKQMKSYVARLQEESSSYPTGYGTSYECRATEQVVENGKIVNKTVFKTVNPKDKFAGLKASDFALENVIAVGALDSLQECQLHVGVNSELADSMEGTVDNVIAAVDAAEANVEPQNND